MNVHPIHLTGRHRREEAERRGYDPHERPTPIPAHLLPGEGVDPLTVFAAEVRRARDTNERTWTA